MFIVLLQIIDMDWDNFYLVVFFVIYIGGVYCCNEVKVFISN